MTDNAEQYARNGFCLLSAGAIADPLIEQAQRGMIEVRDGHFDTGVPPTSHPGYDPGKLCKIDAAHTANTALYKLLTESRLGESIAAVTGSQMVQVWASQLLIKPSGSAEAGHVGWHQDRQYWAFWQGDEGLFTAWIALSDVGADSGPMCFVPGSHRWGFLNQGNFFASDQQALREAIDMPEGESWQEIPAILPAGGVSLHHGLTFHGSYANTSGQPRCSLAVHLRDERAQPVPGDESYYVSHLNESQYSPVIYGAL